MIQDICREWLDVQKQSKQTMSLDKVRKWMDEDEFLVYVRKWKESMWKQLLDLTGFDQDEEKKKLSKQAVLKNPELFGYHYETFKYLKGKKQAKEDL